MTDLHLDARRHAQDLRDTWQARALAETSGRLQAVILAVLFHNYRSAMQVLLRVVFPNAPIARNGWTEINLPFLFGGATINRAGRVTCGMVTRDRSKEPRAIVYESEGVLIKEMRDLADRLQFTDQDRIEMTQAMKNWVIRDLRVDHLARKLAS